MGYRIDYSKGPAKRHRFVFTQSRKAAIKLSAITAALLLALGLIVCNGDAVKDFLLPGDPAVTENALQDMVTDIRAGDDMRDAFAAFCQKILEGAEYHG